MEKLVNQIIKSWFGADPATWPGAQWVHFGAMLLVGLVVAGLVATYAGIVTWVFRKVAGRMQSRIGANRNGPHGFFQWIADAVKLLLKEDLIPKDADKPLFRIAPYFAFTGLLLTFVAIPVSARVVVADLNVGVYFMIAVTALVVVGVLMSGWASNSKWSLFGAIRSAAQVVSYEIPSGLALLVPVLMAGTLSTQGLIGVQGGPQDGAWWQVGGWPWNWTVFANPWAFVAFFVMFIATLAEGNRVPFDLPEAESELVAGYHVEYSGIRFAVFFLTEFGNVFVISALATILFLGGWQIPGVSLETLQSGPWWLDAISIGVFLLKIVALTFLVIWIGWTMPRIRVDQMMSLCWKYLVPTALVLVVVTAASEWLLAGVPTGIVFAGRLLFFVVAGLVPFVLFTRQTFRNIRLVGDKVDLSNW
jgi:NADH-quinone oxidoreductase subunit H